LSGAATRTGLWARFAIGASALFAALCLSTSTCEAASLQFCERGREPTADQQDVLLRFSAVVKETLSESGQDVALIARSGLDLHWLDTRYSHEGVALRSDGGADPRWAIRELYYSCDEKKPRVYDEGLAGFLLGDDDPKTGWVSIVLLPPAESDALRRTASDKRQALGVLGATYSANAYPFSTQFQNCNQWVIELLADAWDDQRDTDDDASTAASRARAQRWLYGQGYRPTVFTASARPMMWLANAVPWMNNADHPADELANDSYSVSMPSSVETFVQAKVPGAKRIEICHSARRVVVHEGWDKIADGCVAGPGDRVIELTAD
jgi:hypothetical protein